MSRNYENKHGLLTCKEGHSVEPELDQEKFKIMLDVANNISHELGGQLMDSQMKILRQDRLTQYHEELFDLSPTITS